MSRSEAFPGSVSPLRLPRRRQALRVAGALLSLGLTACSSVPPLPEQPGATVHLGRFSVSWREQAVDAPWQRSSGRFQVAVTGSTTRLDVASPLGQTLAVATLSPGRAELVTASGTRFESDRPETLTQQAFGWPAPLAQLPRWLGTQRAVSTPAAPADGLRFEEAGWLVEIEAWQGAMPSRLSLRWPTAAATPPTTIGSPAPAEVQLRLVLDPPPSADPAPPPAR